jgi:predicted nucleic-acid-binding protein
MTGDVAKQAIVAQRELANAELVCIAMPALCELVWVLSRGYRIAVSEIVSVIRRLIEAENVAVNRPAVEAGLQLLAAGSDFADGVIAYEGEWLGAETFISFDREAVAHRTARGRSVRLLAPGRSIR